MAVSGRVRTPRTLLLGVFGMGLYPILARIAHPAFLASDTVHGAWVGVCIGLGLVGLNQIRRQMQARGS